MTHLLNLQSLQFTSKSKHYLTGVLFQVSKLFNFVAETRSSRFVDEISMLLTSHIIWPNSLSPVNLTNFPLEQQAVPHVLKSKIITKKEW